MNKIREAIDEYLALRRSLGFKLRDHENALHEFASFLKERGAFHITARLAVQWAKQPQGVLPAHWARRLSIVRGFAKFWSATDLRSEIPPQGLLPYRYVRRGPYIYTPGQIFQLVEAASHLPSQWELRSWTYCTFFGLLAATGLRISEAIALDREDVDLDQGILTIRQTKFAKSRLVPLHTTTRQELRRYAQRRDQIYPRSESPAFFLSDHGARVTQWAARATFVKISRQIGLRGPTDSHGPRLHDLRHTMAVRTLIQWYRAGLDIARQMPKLSTYLGHAHVSDTYWYISATPELLRLASARMARAKGGGQ